MTEQTRDIPVEQLKRGRYQPREWFNPDELQQLADSVRAQGVVQPLIVRQVMGATPFEIVAGERRWRAAQIAGLHEVPCLVRDLTDEQALEIAVIENIQRESLTPIEEARGLQRMIDEFGVTKRDLAFKLGKNESTLTHVTRLLKLDLDVQDMVHFGKLSVGHAKVLLQLPQREQRQWAQKVVKHGWSVRHLEKQSQEAPSKKQGKGREEVDPNLARLNERLTERFNTPSYLEHNNKRKQGRLVINYYSLDELDGILTKLGLFEES